MRSSVFALYLCLDFQSAVPALPLGKHRKIFVAAAKCYLKHRQPGRRCSGAIRNLRGASTVRAGGAVNLLMQIILRSVEFVERRINKST